ncbi:MAG: (Fe-S)-binding protein [Anaerolineales bacterium]|jgi:Fe-S oxidoreductase
MRITSFDEYLVGCRFCPMCAPFGEVSNVTKDEAHSTRVRGMLLWQIANQKASWSEETSDLIYQSTLDSISQAWCINHYPVPEYILSARADIVDAGLAPYPVKQLGRKINPDFTTQLENPATTDAKIVFYPGDSIAGENLFAAKAALKFLSLAGIKASLPKILIDCGGLAYSLGRQVLAGESAKEVNASLGSGGTILVDGPLTYWMLTKVYPKLGTPLPSEVKVFLLLDYLLERYDQGELDLPGKSLRVYTLGSEYSRLTEAGYTSFRRLLEAIPGIKVIEPYDGLELAHASGVGGGLHLVHPDLSAAVSKQRIEEALKANAEWVICDSPLDAAHLKQFAGEDISIGTLPEILYQ